MSGPSGAARAQPDKDLLRFLTCGSVDDGKSTLIGRLLYECALVLDDQLAILERESMRVFPLSNWTELDIWEYIATEEIPVVPLYFARPRSVLQRNGVWIMVDDDRLPLEPGERPEIRRIRFRTLGCYPLTGAIESAAATPTDIVAELRDARQSERQGRLIDSDEEAAMERKKREGYF